MGHRERLAKLEAAIGKSNEAVILPTLPGMTGEEALRLWFGPDRSTWPPSGADHVLLVNGLDLPFKFTDDIPHEFMEQRGAFLFKIWWNQLCEFFDNYRRQVEEKTGHGLMLKTIPPRTKHVQVPLHVDGHPIRGARLCFELKDTTMRTHDLHASSSVAALTAAFPRSPRIAFAPETGAGAGAVQGSGRAAPPTKRDAARKDDAEGTPPDEDKLDRLLSALTMIRTGQKAITDRLDALEARGTADAVLPDPKEMTEAEKVAMAERLAAEQTRADDASPMSRIDREVAAITERMPFGVRQRVEAARDQALASVQSKADSAYSLHGKRAPMALMGERVMAYRVRLARELQRFSPAHTGVNLDAIARADEAGFGAIEARIYADSAEASKRPEGPEDGLMLRERFDKDMQRNVKEYFGRKSYTRLLSPVAQRFAGFKVEPRPY